MRAGATIRLAILLAIAAGAPAMARPMFGSGPLCRDTKGIARPCAPREAGRSSASSRQASAPRTRPTVAGAAVASAVSASAVSAPAAPPPRQKRALFGMGKLCADSKGVARPCPR